MIFFLSQNENQFLDRNKTHTRTQNSLAAEGSIIPPNIIRVPLGNIEIESFQFHNPLLNGTSQDSLDLKGGD